MKRVLLSMALFMAAICVSFAQTKDVKEAKRLATGTNPDFGKAEALINSALQAPESKDDAATWDVAGFIQKRINDKEMEKAYLQQAHDKNKLYNTALGMYKYWLKADDLAQIPDAKGKIKNKFRKNNLATLKIERINLLNGGVENFNNENSEKALEFFAMYIDASSHPMFEKENYLQTDTLLAQVAYYAALAATKLGNNAAVLKYAPYGVDDKEVGAYNMEFICTAHKAEGDTVQWVNALKEGIRKYPLHQFFFGNLVDYYSSNNKYDEAMTFADDMIAQDPNNTFFAYVKGYLYHNMKDYDKAIEFYKKTIELDPTYAEAYSNIGLVYGQMAQDYTEQMKPDASQAQYEADQAKIREFNELARPYYEKVRELKPESTDLWMQGLYRVYYNLNMGPEFEEIEKLMGL